MAASSNAIAVGSADLARHIAQLFTALGSSEAHAQMLADSLVAADLEGVSSHGVMLVPMYVERVRAGSVKLDALPTIEEDHGGLLVLDAHHGLGQVSSQRAVELAVERAKMHGVSAVSVRSAFHFGAAAYWTRQLARAGMVGFACSNTRPLMPAPGGAQPLIGNNPLSIAFPSENGAPLVVDMAMSNSAMGKIRLAAGQGKPIPDSWATDAQGNPTTNASEAIKGMLLPAAGPKGFGLAVAVDLLCGALSGGAIAAQVRPLYGDPAQPYDCAHTFIAIDSRHAQGGQGIGSRVDALAGDIRGARRAEGVDRLYAPGDLEQARRASANGRCTLSIELFSQLNQLAERHGIPHRLNSILS